MKKSKLPKFDTIEQMAEFFETHDTTDFEDEFEEVTEPVFVRRSDRLRGKNMPPTLEELGIDQMSVRERIALAQEILDSVLAEMPRGPLSEAKKQELERRLADETANPGDVITWEQVQAEAQDSFRK